MAPATDACVSTLRGHSHIVRDLVFHPNGHLLASGSADGTVRLWDVRSGQTRQLFVGGGSEITRLAFDPDGRVLASVSADRVVRLWEVETGRALDTLTGYMSAVLAVRFRPDGRQLASGSGDGRIHLWEQQPWPACGRASRACRTGDRGGVQPRWPAAGQRQHGTRRSSCGIWPAADRSARCVGIRARSKRWRSVPTGGCWPAPASTGRSASGP